VPYFGYILDDCVAILERKAVTGVPGEVVEELVQEVIESLSRCFKYDTESFTTKERFDKLLLPLVKELERTECGAELYKKKALKLADCLSNMAVAVGNDTLWKPLNYQVLLRTRDDSPLIRFAALQVIQKLYQRLEEEFVVLVPETVPFLAELMEDSNPQVERLCYDVIKTINTFLGDEKIEDYF